MNYQPIPNEIKTSQEGRKYYVSGIYVHNSVWWCKIKYLDGEKEMIDVKYNRIFY